MLESVTVENYKSIRRLDLSFQRLTVIVGPNGCGKSSVLDAVELLHTTFASDPSEGTLAGDTKLQVQENFRRPESASVAVRGVIDTREVSFRIDGPTWKNGLSDYAGQPYSWFPLVRDGNSNLVKPKAVDRPPLVAPVRLRLSPEVIMRPSIAATGTPTPAADGSNLATYVSYLATRRDPTLEKLETLARTVVPRFRRLNFQAADVEGNPGWRLEAEFDGVGAVSASALSEGTLLTLAILAATIGGNNLVLLDDIDRGLHPTAQIELMRGLKALVEESPGLQIIATTHSPFIVSGLKPEEVIRLGFGEDGLPCVVPTHDVPAIMTPSEIADEYFGVETTGASELLQEYGTLATDPQRNDNDDRRLQALVGQLRGLGVEPELKPVARR